MKVTVNNESADINRYYVQTLCMIFFPGEKFSDSDDQSPYSICVDCEERENEFYAKAVLKANDKEYIKDSTVEYTPDKTKKRSKKIAVGNAVLAVCNEHCGYRSSWGMLTGVRPSKVASELLMKGFSKTKAKKMLVSDYRLFHKKAELSVDVALAEKRIIGTPGKKDCSIYISIPFCPTRCDYCSFVCYTSKKLLSLIPEYLEILKNEIKDAFSMIDELGLNVKSVYIGGGTPTILSESELLDLLSCVRACLGNREIEEFTLEGGRPDTITEEKLKIAKDHGITRVCVNPQTLNQSVLDAIGRRHTVDEFFRAFEIVKNSGIENINTDLIAGLPGDDFDMFSSSLDRIIALDPTNITIHTFCVKKSAELLRKNPNIYSMRGGDVGRSIDYSQMQLPFNGYYPYYMYRQKNSMGNYENVGFAKPGCEGRYNIYMMEEIHSIFAVGAGAVSKLVKYVPANIGDSKIIRLFNPKYPYEYLKTENREHPYEHFKDTVSDFYKEHIGAEE
ncbi:MAG: coproporphyrinogen dehydrogenase HemZ [Clostridia bacterium]|nr:coproporphyrinogen dehydrogenase HemZ [Clostridia bacterium]